MNNIKKSWNKLKYWQKGAIIGIIVGIFMIIYIYAKGGNLLVLSGNAFQFFGYIFQLIPLILHSLLFDNVYNDRINLNNAIVITLWYIFLGAIFGLLYSFFIKKYSKHPAKVFVILLIVFILVLFIINFSTLVFLGMSAA